MKPKIETYLAFTKGVKISEVCSDSDGRLVLKEDVENCLWAVRGVPASQQQSGRGSLLLTIQYWEQQQRRDQYLPVKQRHARVPGNRQRLLGNSRGPYTNIIRGEVARSQPPVPQSISVAHTGGSQQNELIAEAAAALCCISAINNKQPLC